MPDDTVEIYDPPQSTRCPMCGWEPPEDAREDAALQERLSDAGYLHRDYTFECDECGADWMCGTPAGDYDGGRDLWCNSCDSGFMQVHRIVTDADDLASNQIRLHLKCPNHSGFDCPDCPHTDSVDYDRDGTPRCPRCRIELDRDDLPGCFYFDKVDRTGDDAGVFLVGYPHLTGDTNGANPYGWADESSGVE